jgi:hypothetical protein
MEFEKYIKHYFVNCGIFCDRDRSYINITEVETLYTTIMLSNTGTFMIVAYTRINMPEFEALYQLITLRFP